MVRVTDEKKQIIRKSILEVSQKHFMKNGYDKTKTKDIAKEVGIAEGTLFNYFDTKTEIFLEAITAGYMVDLNAIESVNFKDEIADIIFDLFYKTMKHLTKIPRKIIKEVFSASINVAKRKPELIKKIIQLDYNLLKDLEGILENLMIENRLKTCNVKVFAEVIFSAVIVEITMYVFEDKITLEEMLHNVKEKIDFTLEGHVL